MKELIQNMVKGVLGHSQKTTRSDNIHRRMISIWYGLMYSSNSGRELGIVSLDKGMLTKKYLRHEKRLEVVILFPWVIQ
jgi:hypothetical protein